MRLTAFCGLAVLLAAAGPARAQTEALSVDDVLGLRQRGVSTHRILYYAHTYCVSFVLTDSIEKLLRDAGADGVLLDGLRTTCTTEAPLTRHTAGTLLDVDFASAQGLPGSSSTDGLCSATFERDGLRFDNRRRDAACLIDYPSDSIPGNASLELTVRGLATSYHEVAVLGFGHPTGQAVHYLLSIGRDQRVRLSWNGASSSRTLLDRYASGIGAAPSGQDVVRVEVRGRVLTVVVNGATVGFAEAPDEVGGGLMLGVGPRTNVAFEHLRVRVLQNGELARH